MDDSNWKESTSSKIGRNVSRVNRNSLENFTTLNTLTPQTGRDLGLNPSGEAFVERLIEKKISEAIQSFKIAHECHCDEPAPHRTEASRSANVPEFSQTSESRPTIPPHPPHIPPHPWHERTHAATPDINNAGTLKNEPIIEHTKRASNLSSDDSNKTVPFPDQCLSQTIEPHPPVPMHLTDNRYILAYTAFLQLFKAFARTSDRKYVDEMTKRFEEIKRSKAIDDELTAHSPNLPLWKFLHSNEPEPRNQETVQGIIDCALERVDPESVPRPGDIPLSWLLELVTWRRVVALKKGLSLYKTERPDGVVLSLEDVMKFVIAGCYLLATEVFVGLNIVARSEQHPGGPEVRDTTAMMIVSDVLGALEARARSSKGRV